MKDANNTLELMAERYEQNQKIRRERNLKIYYEEQQVRLNELAQIAKKLGYKLAPIVNKNEGPWISDAERLHAYISCMHYTMKTLNGVICWVSKKCYGYDYGATLLRHLDMPRGIFYKFMQEVAERKQHKFGYLLLDNHVDFWSEAKLGKFRVDFFIYTPKCDGLRGWCRKCQTRRREAIEI